MAVTIAEMEQRLIEVGIQHYDVHEHYILFSMETEHYAAPSGQNVLRIALELSEDGEYFKLFAPRAYQIAGPNTDVFLRAVAMVQWRTKLIQFEFDESDGEVRPIIEWPVQDGTITMHQLGRSLHGLVQIVEQFHPILERARIEGVVEFPDTKEAMIERLETLVARMKGLHREGDDSEGGSAPPEAF